jgi:hypothetical protein
MNTIEDLYTRLQKINNLVCEARNLAEELESDVSDPREWKVDEWQLDNHQLMITSWRDELETIEGDMDDFIPQKTE